MYTHIYVRRYDVYVCIYVPAYAARVLEAMKDKFFYIKVKVWNESHIIWEPFQTPNFQLYKALHGIFQKHTKNPKGKPKIP